MALLNLFQKHPHWNAVEVIHRTLSQKGFRVVLAGGCVRDALLGRLASDIDIATEATPEQIEALFSRVVPVGKSFGVCQVVIDGFAIEVATFREESDYEDGRRPNHIVYSNLERDALRRDFTVNALFFDLEDHSVIDLVGGQEDLAAKVLRTVGDPQRRFNEDHLRVVRGLRFAAQLGFVIEVETLSSLKACVPLVRSVSHERILAEYKKAFERDAAWPFLDYCKEAQLFETLYQGWVWQYQAQFRGLSIEDWDSWEHLQKKINMAQNSLQIWLELSLHVVRHYNYVNGSRADVSLEYAHSWLKELRLDSKTIKWVMAALKTASVFISPHDYEFSDHLLVARMDDFSQLAEYWQKELQAFDLQSDTFWTDFKIKYMREGSLPAPLLSGKDLVALGIEPGPRFSVLLQEAYVRQIQFAMSDKQKLIASLSL